MGGHLHVGVTWVVRCNLGGHLHVGVTWVVTYVLTIFVLFKLSGVIMVWLLVMVFCRVVRKLVLCLGGMECGWHDNKNQLCEVRTWVWECFLFLKTMVHFVI